MAKILVADDERSVRTTLKELLEIEGHTPVIVSDGRAALAEFKTTKFDLVITDLKMPYLSGDKLIAELKLLDPNVVIIAISAYHQIPNVVGCMREGAINFISKPIEFNTLLTAIAEALTYRDNPKNNVQKSRPLIEPKYEMIGTSAPMEEVRQLIEKVAPSDARVLITGENGTGKELVAHAIHNKSKRNKAPFITLNCAAIPADLIESELFGHEKGSFTSAIKLRLGKFEQANGGTLFLDEIGDMNISAQAKVLRTLEENKISRIGAENDINIDVRVICATNKSLSEEIKNGSFREDLYHRLGVIVIKVPSLNQRTEDIPLLINHFVEQVCAKINVEHKEFTPKAIEMLQKYPWSGNIRELRNVIERLLVLGENPIDQTDIEIYVEPYLIQL